MPLLETSASQFASVRRLISPPRLLETVRQLVAVASPTGAAGDAADVLADMLREAGFEPCRPAAAHPAAPAVVVRHDTGLPGRVLQFNAHLDTVHLPFAPPRAVGDRLYGSGSVDMKGGLAAAIEALRVLRDGELLAAGSVLLTAHDLHESPWGDGRQLDSLIDEGYVGDAVLIPEYLYDRLPVVGRGGLIWKATFTRPEPAVHESLRSDQPSLPQVAAEFLLSVHDLDRRLSTRRAPLVGSESVFIGQCHVGMLYNQDPQTAWVEGTRRWLPGTTREAAEEEIRRAAETVAARHRVRVSLDCTLMRDAFTLDPRDEIAVCFQAACVDVSGAPLPEGAKPFVDDGSTFTARAGIPAITHGPRGEGAHTVEEWVSISDLERVAAVYALTAMRYCPQT